MEQSVDDIFIMTACHDWSNTVSGRSGRSGRSSISISISIISIISTLSVTLSLSSKYHSNISTYQHISILHLTTILSRSRIYSSSYSDLNNSPMTTTAKIISDRQYASFPGIPRPTKYSFPPQLRSHFSIIGFFFILPTTGIFSKASHLWLSPFPKKYGKCFDQKSGLQ